MILKGTVQILAAMSISRSDNVTHFVRPFVHPSFFFFSFFGISKSKDFQWCFRNVEGCFLEFSMSMMVASWDIQGLPFFKEV